MGVSLSVRVYTCVFYSPCLSMCGRVCMCIMCVCVVKRCLSASAPLLALEFQWSVRERDEEDVREQLKTCERYCVVLESCDRLRRHSLRLKRYIVGGSFSFKIFM